MAVCKRAWIGALLAGLAQDLSAAESLPSVDFKIESQDLQGAVRVLVRQARLRHYVLLISAELASRRVPAIQGSLTPRAALGEMLAGSGLSFEIDADRHLTIREAPKLVHTTTATVVAPQAVPATIEPYEEVIVVSRVPLNTDALRTEDDAQPWIVIGRDQLDRSPGTLVEAISRLLPANVPDSKTQDGGIHAGHPTLNLRGLGSNHTLVLVDGRQISDLSIGGLVRQTDLTTIPIEAIDHIDVLPATASGIYGGGATGGVVNVVLRRDCRTRLAVNYGDTFSADAGNESGFASHCFTFGEGQKTQLRLTGGFSNSDSLTLGQRDFLARGRNAIAANNASFFADTSAPPLGAQANIRSLEGSPLGAGLAAFTSVPAGYAGGVDSLLANAGRYNMDTAASAQAMGGGLFPLTNEQRTSRFNATVDHPLSESLTAYVDATLSDNVVRRPENLAQYAGLEGIIVPPGQGGNPFDQAVVVTVPAVDSDRLVENRQRSSSATTGVRFALSEGGHVTTEYTRAASKLEWRQPMACSVADDIESGALNLFRDFAAEPLNLDAYSGWRTVPSLKSRTDIGLIRGDMPLEGLGVQAELVGSLQYRHERFAGGPENVGVAGAVAAPVAFYTRQERRIVSGYAEARIGSRTLHSLELQIATRFDRYAFRPQQPHVDIDSLDASTALRTSFSSMNPTIGLRWQPSDSITLRTSIGTGFLPPSGEQLAPSEPTVFPAGVFFDARRNEMMGKIDFTAGGNPNLNPERSRSFSAGIVWDSKLIDGLHASLDYTRTIKRDEVVSCADVFFVDPALAEQACPNSFTREGDGGPVIAFDGSVLNAAKSKVEAIDAAVDWQFRDTAVGNVNFWMRGTYEPTQWMRANSVSAERNLAGVSGYALKVSAVAGLRVARAGWEAEWTTRYFGPYAAGLSATTNANQGWHDVRAQTFHDVSVSYRFGEPSEETQSVVVSLSAVNLFDKRPAFDAGTLTYASVLGDPRMARYVLSVTTAF